MKEDERNVSLGDKNYYKLCKQKTKTYDNSIRYDSPLMLFVSLNFTPRWSVQSL